MINPDAAAFTNPVVLERNDECESSSEFNERVKKIKEYMEKNGTISIRAYMATQMMAGMIPKAGLHINLEADLKYYANRAVMSADALIYKLNGGE